MPYGVRSYRSQSKYHPFYSQIEAMGIGDEYVAKGFDSTSIKPNWAWGTGDVRVEYQMPAGTRAFYFNAIASSVYEHEYELMPARGSRWQLTSKRVESNGKITATVELVSQPEGYAAEEGAE